MEVLRFSHEKKRKKKKTPERVKLETQIKPLEEFSVFFLFFGFVNRVWWRTAEVEKTSHVLERQSLERKKKQLHEISFLSSDDTDNTLNSTSAE